MNDLIQLTFDKIIQNQSYTIVTLVGEKKRFAIYAEANLASLLQMYLTNKKKQRPLTHELISHIFTGFDIRIKHITIVDIQDAIYFAKLFLEQHQDGRKTVVEIDARPSDCLVLALIHNIPVYCNRHVLETAAPIED